MTFVFWYENLMKKVSSIKNQTEARQTCIRIIIWFYPSQVLHIRISINLYNGIYIIYILECSVLIKY